MRILLVEDNAGDARLIQEFLKDELSNFELSIAPRFEAARKFLIENPTQFDVILLDLALPDSFGLETLDRVIELSPKSTAIIVLTGNDDKEIAVHSVRRGAQDFITKGHFTAESLVKAIRYAIERKHTEATILEQQRALLHAAKLSTMGELTAFVFHEILNPLSVISMSAEHLAMQIGSDAGDRNGRLIGTISRNIDRIAKITNGLKRFSRGDKSDPFEKVQLTQLLSGVIELCEDRFKSKGIPFEIIKPEGMLEFYCREVQIAQVLVNLLNNAFDAVKNLDERWVRLEIHDHGKFIQFGVKDSGRGIPSDLVDKILESFFTTKASDGGTGLGLSISKRIIDEHNGTLEIDRTSPNTYFVFRLPKSPNNKLAHLKSQLVTSNSLEQSAH